MSDNILELKRSIKNYCVCGGSIILRENERLSAHCTFKIGGEARLYAIPQSVESTAWIVSEAKKLGVKWFILGHGSNLLFDDAGFDGVIISTEALNSITFDGNFVTAECGALLSKCAAMARDAGLSGMECLFGIPGSVGGAVYMNAGAYGGEMSDIVVSTTYLDTESMETREISGDAHGFGYRHSIFCDNKNIVLQTKMSLKEGNIDEIAEKMNEYKRLRFEKQPLEYPSAGSTFKRYPGRYTAQMIDEAGLKGFSVGGAQVSEKHAGFVINKGGATSDDVLKLIETIKGKIYDLYGIEIETEVIHIK